MSLLRCALCHRNLAFMYLYTFLLVSGRKVNLGRVTPSWVETSSAYHGLEVLFSHLLYSPTFSGMYFTYKEGKLSLC